MHSCHPLCSLKSPHSHFKTRELGLRGGAVQPKSTQQNDRAGISAEICLMPKPQVFQGYPASSSSPQSLGSRTGHGMWAETRRLIQVVLRVLARIV